MQRMRRSHLLGLFLWRGGLLCAVGYAVYEGAWWALFFWDVPDQLKAGGALLLAGAALVLGSLLAERIADARLEGDLRS